LVIICIIGLPDKVLFPKRGEKVKAVKQESFIFALIIFYSIFLLFSFIHTTQAKPIEWEDLLERSRDNLNKNPDNHTARFEYALSLANTGQVEESYEQFDILGEEENREDARNEVEKVLEKMENQGEDNVLKLNYLAFLAVVDKNYEESIQYFEKIIDINPDNVWIYNYLAASYFELDKLNKAHKIAGEALEIKENSYSHVLHGMIYLEKDEYFKAIHSFSRSGKLSRIIEEIF